MLSQTVLLWFIRWIIDQWHSPLLFDCAAFRCGGKDQRGADCSHRLGGHRHVFLAPDRLCHPWEKKSKNFLLRGAARGITRGYLSHIHYWNLFCSYVWLKVCQTVIISSCTIQNYFGTRMHYWNALTHQWNTLKQTTASFHTIKMLSHTSHIFSLHIFSPETHTTETFSHTTETLLQRWLKLISLICSTDTNIFTHLSDFVSHIYTTEMLSHENWAVTYTIDFYLFFFFCLHTLLKRCHTNYWNHLTYTTEILSHIKNTDTFMS